MNPLETEFNKRFSKWEITLPPDALRAKLRIGVHCDVEVTDAKDASRQSVSQAFCSALPVAYSRVPGIHWSAFASLILEAAYEATILAGMWNAQRGRSNVVLLTRLGGGAFGNADEWINSAMRRALHISEGWGLDIRLVSYRPPTLALQRLAEEFR